MGSESRSNTRLDVFFATANESRNGKGILDFVNTTATIVFGLLVGISVQRIFEIVEEKKNRDGSSLREVQQEVQNILTRI